MLCLCDPVAPQFAYSAAAQNKYYPESLIATNQSMDFDSTGQTYVDKDGGSITFLIRFRRFPGRAVYHCHFATHGDLGMMGVAEVVRPGEEPVGVLGGHH